MEYVEAGDDMDVEAAGDESTDPVTSLVSQALNGITLAAEGETAVATAHSSAHLRTEGRGPNPLGGRGVVAAVCAGVAMVAVGIVALASRHPHAVASNDATAVALRPAQSASAVI
jgi:hypothetical protein